MTTFHGLPEFDPRGVITWDIYAERLQFFLEANGIDDVVKKRAVLLSSCGNATYEIVRSLCAPEKPAKVTYDQFPSSNEYWQMLGITLHQYWNIGQQCLYSTNIGPMLQIQS
ncbi:hypothetical protein RI129_008404 [Pyrocoelia pectoralis]|uniref:Uncharacterized protein n=1 Tax=Pyrocoelia pectoralis TaxID=417401 RepID=A0AAN7V7A5_9COLE